MFTPLATRYPRYSDQKYSPIILNGQELKRIERRGKFLVFFFSGMEDILVLNHLGMSGSWQRFESFAELSKNAEEPKLKYSKVVIEFTDRSLLVFCDTRNFGRFLIAKGEPELDQLTPSLKKVGPDGFQISGNVLRERIMLKKSPIGEVLLDQRTISGVGNIYKSESLWRAKINPLVPACDLTESETFLLAESIRNTLQQAYQDGGSSIQDFTSAKGEVGRAQEWHAVYGREDDPCQTCGTAILRLIQKSRSTFYCPNCQQKTEKQSQPP